LIGDRRTTHGPRHEKGALEVDKMALIVVLNPSVYKNVTMPSRGMLADLQLNL
jgi:hypothetical protein